MLHSKEYFAVQIKFAQKVSEVTGMSLSDAILNYTTCYKKFEIEGWDFNSKHPIWSDFSKLLENSNDPVSVVYNFYLERQKIQEEDALSPFGCFSYEYDKGRKHVQIHFKQKDNSGIGPLSLDKIEMRKGELKRMFDDIKARYPEAETVGGFSWLYNVEAYRRLFPPEYTKNSKVNQTWFKSYALWGQFVNFKKELKKDMASGFIACIDSKDDLDGLRGCFPWLVVEPRADIGYFHRFYDLE